MKLIALIKRAQQISPDDWDTWTEAFEVAQGESVESVYARIKARTRYNPDEIRIVPLQTEKEGPF